MKMFTLLFIGIIFYFFSFGQSLSIHFFENNPYLYLPEHQNTLRKSGFLFESDSIQNRKSIYLFINKKTNEIIETSSAEDIEGAKTISVKYFMADFKSYNQFINLLKKSKYKSVSSKNVFVYNTSSYSTNSFVTKGEVLLKNKKYFMILFRDINGKELSFPIE